MPVIAGVIEQDEWRWVLVASSLLIIAISIPFVWAYAAAVPGHCFGGFLVNPVDGHSYLAKMYQGYSGGWLYTLPYTPEPHQGVMLFSFYLAPGHLARLLSLPLILDFHTARLKGSLLMLLSLYVFVSDWTDDVTQRRITWGLAAVGSGFGVFALMAGRATPTPDLNMPEGFLLYAAYANAHFPWAISALIWVAHTLTRVILVERDLQPMLHIHSLVLTAATLLLMSISPFGLAPLGIGVGALLALLWRGQKQFPLREFEWSLVPLIFGLPLFAYNIWAISGANPAFQAWMRQNLTPSPPVWDYLIAYGLLLALGAVGILRGCRTLDGGDALLLAWLIGGAVLLYAPIGLQRRFTMGLILPLSIYAGRGVWRVLVPLVGRRLRPILISVIFLLAAPTTVLVITLPMAGVAARDGRLYVTDEETALLDWVTDNTPGDSLVLASPDYSLYLPARGRRVVYGHPFETLHAEEREREVISFYAGVDCSVVPNEGVDYVVVGPREHALGQGEKECPIPGELAVRFGDVELYVVGEE